MNLGRRLFLIATLAMAGWSRASASTSSYPQPIDKGATPETKNLFRNMLRVAPSTVMFGHQNALAYGTSWRDSGEGPPTRSDVKDVVGDYPAVYGWDLMDVFGKARAGELGGGGEGRMRDYVRSAHARGGINTFSWHMDNPASGKDAWDTTPAVDKLLPGGAHHSAFKEQLDRAAAFFLSLTDNNGKLIPVWFRPFHEQTGGWFWWGKGHTSPDDFKALWRFTVDHLRNTRGVHNLLYAFSTDVFDSAQAYFEFYPGDDYVDLLGFDDYHSIKSTKTLETFSRRLRMIVRWARERGKLAAVTETGLEGIGIRNWWTGILLNGIIADRDTLGISYVLVWRNANQEFDRKGHFYAPYPGQKSAPDFKVFFEDPRTWFGRDLPDFYNDEGN